MSAQQLKRHRVPAWWSDAKLGIFIHWTPASVIGWAPIDREVGELMVTPPPGPLADSPLAEMPYTEWYENSLRFPGSSARRHHDTEHRGTTYRSLGERFRAGLEQWDPTAWARTFAATGARYVVLVSKHHDGFCLWPSNVRNPNVDGWHTERDVVGELAEAVRGEGMRFGLYYSGGLDWTFDDRPIGTVADLLAACPRGGYPAYAEAQVRELVARYRPSVLWNDISWPSGRQRLFDLFEHYYASVSDGVVNDRFMPASGIGLAARNTLVRRGLDAGLTWHARRSHGGIVPPTPPHYDVQTPEYTVFPGIRERPFETVRGMDRSFGYNRNSTPDLFLSERELLGTLSDVAAKGGNLLLNVGPKGEDASIPGEQLDRLRWLARWDAASGGVADTRPWVRPSAVTPDGVELRFVARGDVVSAVCMGDVVGALTIPGVRPTAATRVVLRSAEVGDGGSPVEWTAVDGGVRVTVSGSAVHWPIVDLCHVDAGVAIPVHVDAVDAPFGEVGE